MKIFLDTNILIDNLDDSRWGAEASKEVVRICGQDENRGLISALSVPNVLYVFRRIMRAREEKSFIVRSLCNAFDVVSLERGDLIMATGEDFADYEDGLQCLAAEKMGVDCIVTNDKRGFSGAKVKVLTPREFLIAYGEGRRQENGLAESERLV